MKDKELNKIIRNAKLKAKEVIKNTAHIREEFARGENSSYPAPESTVEGTLKACQFIVDNFTPTGYTRRK